MVNPAQLMYLETVLGVSLDSFAAVVPQPAPEATGQPLKILVKTPAVTFDEKTLLAKIMSAAKVDDYFHVEDLANNASALHVLEFSDTLPLGKSVTPKGEFHWQLPSLSKMTGQGIEITSLKKITWTWMQALTKEL